MAYTDRCRYEMLTDIIHFLRTFDWSAPNGVPEDLQRLMFDVWDETMRTGFVSVLELNVRFILISNPDTYPLANAIRHQSDPLKMDATLRQRIASLLLRDSSSLRHYVEGSFITNAYVPFCVSSLSATLTWTTG